MNRLKCKVIGWVLVFGFITSCATGGNQSLLVDQRAELPDQQYLWVGEGTYFEYNDGQWEPDKSQDYQFLVRQNRFEDRWESLKVQNRTHPDYDGAAGPADQQHFFRVIYGPRTTEGQITFDLMTTFGDGQGRIDEDFVLGTMDFEARGVSSFAPYNRFRITQTYDYDQGTLVETVLLYLLRKDGREIPFAKIEERATLSVPLGMHTR